MPYVQIMLLERAMFQQPKKKHSQNKAGCLLLKVSAMAVTFLTSPTPYASKTFSIFDLSMRQGGLTGFLECKVKGLQFLGSWIYQKRHNHLPLMKEIICEYH